MVPHKVHLQCKQYIENKPIRWGIKLWVLCEAKRGHVLNFQVYLCKEGGHVEQHLARRVVKALILPIANKFHYLYMDNFYCDPHLFLELDRKQVLACGTIRANWKGLIPFRFSTYICYRKEDGPWRLRMEVPWKSGCHALVWPALCVFDLHYSSSWKYWWTNHRSVSFC